MGTKVRLAFAAFAIYTIIRFGIVAIEPPGMIPTDFRVSFTAAERLTFNQRGAIYNAGEESPFKYSPTFLLFFKHTFGEFSIHMAWTFWCALSIGIFLWAALWFASPTQKLTLKTPEKTALLIAGFVFGWHGYLLHFSYGQADMLMFALFLFAARLAEDSSSQAQSAFAGFLLAIQLVTKPQTGLLLLYFVLRERWKTLAAAAVFAVTLLFLPVAAWGWPEHLEMLRRWLHSLSLQTPEFMAGNLNQSLAAVFARWTGLTDLIPPSNALFILVSVIAAGATRRFWKRLPPQWLACACLLDYCLVSPLAWRWLTFLWAPIFYVVASSVFSGWRENRMPRLARALCLCFIALGILLQSFVAKAFGIDEPDHLSRVGLFALGNALLLATLILAARPRASHQGTS